MPVQSIQVGVPTVITQNVVYALPASKCFIQALAAVEVSIDNSTWAVLASSTTGAASGAVYVRCTTGNTTIVCKPDA